MRRHGLAVDNLLGAEVVTADGVPRTAREDADADLFWGLRGGGGCLGVVTSYTFGLHPAGPEVLAGSVLWSSDDAPEVLRAYRELVVSSPPEVATIVTLRRAPATPALPVELHLRPVCQVAMLALAEAGRAERLLAPLRTVGRPLLDLVKHRPYTNLQSMLDATVPSGWHYSWRSTGLGRLDDVAIDTMLAHVDRARSPRSYATLIHLGGAVADVDPAATAYSRRDVAHELVIRGVWLPHELLADAETAWVRAFSDDMEPLGRGTYLGFLDHDEQHRRSESFEPAAYRRLVELQRRYDPDGVLQPRLGRGTGDRPGHGHRQPTNALRPAAARAGR